jgi:hypothetical protein
MGTRKVIDLDEERRFRAWLRIAQGADSEVGWAMMADLMDKGRALEALPPQQRTPERVKAFRAYLEAYLELF